MCVYIYICIYVYIYIYRQTDKQTDNKFEYATGIISTPSSFNIEKTSRDVSINAAAGDFCVSKSNINLLFLIQV